MRTDDKHRDHVKVLFEVARDDGGVDVESVWALPVEGGYQIDNIPFYAREIASGDVVSVVNSEGGALRFSGLISASGHSTVRLWFSNEADVLPVRNALRDMGCPSELDVSRLVAVDIPPTVSYGEVRNYLDEKERASIFEYEEACLGQI